jgi:hypothetical protein
MARQFRELSVEKMVQYAESHLQQVDQWKDGDTLGYASNVHEYASKADAVIEMLEWRLHGNHGAVDKAGGQPFTHSLRERLDWIRVAAGIDKPKAAKSRQLDDDKDDL